MSRRQAEARETLMNKLLKRLTACWHAVRHLSSKQHERKAKPVANVLREKRRYSSKMNRQGGFYPLRKSGCQHEKEETGWQKQK